MARLATPENYANGARLARDNAMEWLDDAKYVLGRSPGSHALAAAIMGCEEATKAYTWWMCSLMSPPDAQRWEDAVRKRTDRHYLQMFLAIFLGSLSSALADTPAADIDVVTPVPSFAKHMGQILRQSEVNIPELMSTIPQLPALRSTAFYVDWVESDGRFRTPHDGAPGEAVRYIEAGDKLIKLLGLALPLSERLGPEERGPVAAMLASVLSSLASNDTADLEPLLAELRVELETPPVSGTSPTTP